MTGTAKVRAERVASAVMSGRRHPALRDVYFFHTANASYPRRTCNMWRSPRQRVLQAAAARRAVSRRLAEHHARLEHVLWRLARGDAATALRPAALTKPQTEQQWALPPATRAGEPSRLAAGSAGRDRERRRAAAARLALRSRSGRGRGSDPGRADPDRAAPAQAKPRSINDILAMTEGGGLPLN